VKSNQRYHTIVIGGGPSGMMASATRASLGKSVLLLEKNATLGKKLLITGGGRCNVTNAESDLRKLLSKFKGSDKYLFSAFSKWGVKDTLDFFHNRGLQTKVENENRVFPVTDKAESVWKVLVDYLKESKVEVRSNSEVIGFDSKDGKINAVVLKGGEMIQADSFILATGGTSHKETGSTGDGMKWLKALGHKVSDPDVSLVPVTTSDDWSKSISGVSLTDIKLSLIQFGKKQKSKRGKILFTHFGITGPTVLNMSKDIREMLSYGDLLIEIDLLPSDDHGKLNQKLQEIFKQNSNKKIKNSLSEIVPSSLVDHILELAGIDRDLECNSVKRESRMNLIEVMKHLPLHPTGLLGSDKAIITSGGVSLDEVDFKTMRSKLYPNLHIVGDLLDIDRPSGGYSLQLCFTTGHVAGSSI